MVKPAEGENVRKELSDYIERHNEITNQLKEKGYTIQGSKWSEGFKKCYFAYEQKVIGYIDADTLEVIYY